MGSLSRVYDPQRRTVAVPSVGFFASRLRRFDSSAARIYWNFAEIRLLHLACRMTDWYLVLFTGRNGPVIWILADVVCTSACTVDVDVDPPLCSFVFEYSFPHGGATDVSETDDKH